MNLVHTHGVRDCLNYTYSSHRHEQTYQLIEGKTERHIMGEQIRDTHIHFVIHIEESLLV